MNPNLSRLAAALVLVSLAACKCTDSGATASCQTTLAASDRTAIAANSAAWLKAVHAFNWEAVAATYTTDGMLMPPNEPAVAGREAIRRWFTAFPPIDSIDVVPTEVDGCCDVAYVRGTYELAIAPPGMGTIRETGKYLEIHRKQADGSWLKSRDMFSSDAPPPK